MARPLRIGFGEGEGHIPCLSPELWFVSPDSPIPRRIDLVVGIGYGDSIEDAFAAAMSVMSGDERILQEPAPQVMVSELADSSVNLNLRLWVNGADYWNVLFDLTRSVKETFDERGVEIPYPQHVIHTAADA
jgi:small conductance mechanosensitive channel